MFQPGLPLELHCNLQPVANDPVVAQVIALSFLNKGQISELPMIWTCRSNQVITIS